MITRTATPTTLSRTRRAPAFLHNHALINNIILDQHKILVDPGVTPADAKNAKLRLLDALAEVVRYAVPRVNIAPTAVLPLPALRPPRQRRSGQSLRAFDRPRTATFADAIESFP